MCQKRYRGETGFNAHARLETHEKQILGSVQANSMAWHLTNTFPQPSGPWPQVTCWTTRLCGEMRGGARGYDNYSAQSEESVTDIVIRNT